MKQITKGRHFAGLVILTITAVLMPGPAPAQKLELNETKTTADIGVVYATADLPRPEWHNSVDGLSEAVLSMEKAEAAGYRAHFRSLSLPQGMQLYLQTKDATGAVQSLHGPYEGNGPLNTPDFQSEVLAGSRLELVLRGKAGEQWPFELAGVEVFSRVTELASRAFLQLQRRRPETGPVMSGWSGDRLMAYRVVDGLALAEGDIVLGTAEEMAQGKGSDRTAHATAGDNHARYWKRGIVPYDKDSLLAVHPIMNPAVEQAIAYWNKEFPGILVPRTNEADYVTFRAATDLCASAIGRQGGQQNIWISTGCGSGAVVHEIGHALGFFHEQTRPDRDDYVKILWAAIEGGKEHNFQIPPSGTSKNVGDYDYGSIMHYGIYAFSKWIGVPTIMITGTVPPGVKVGQRDGLSYQDKSAVGSRYCLELNWGLPKELQFSAAGGIQTLFYAAPPYCSVAVSSSEWVPVVGQSNSNGSGVVTFQVGKWNGLTTRWGSLSIGPRQIWIKQLGILGY